MVTLAKIQDTRGLEGHASCILSFGLIGQHQNKRFTSWKSFCCSGSQTLFFGGREATTGNASALRRLTIKDLMKKNDYHHKKAIKTNKKLHWGRYKRLRNAVSMKLRKEKARYHSNQLCEKQESRKLWKTLNELLPNKKQHKTANAPASETFTTTNFNEFFTSVADNPCGHYKSKTRLLLLLELRKTLFFKRCQLTLF